MLQLLPADRCWPGLPPLSPGSFDRCPSQYHNPAHRAFARHAEQSMMELGFCFSDFGTLEALWHKGPQSVTEIALRIGLTAGSMSIARDRLVRRGLLWRHAHPTDRRNRVIRSM